MAERALGIYSEHVANERRSLSQRIELPEGGLLLFVSGGTMRDRESRSTRGGVRAAKIAAALRRYINRRRSPRPAPSGNSIRGIRARG